MVWLERYVGCVEFVGKQHLLAGDVQEFDFATGLASCFAVHQDRLHTVCDSIDR